MSLGSTADSKSATEIFAANLRKLREQKGLSMQALADALKLSKSSINMYERAEREPSLQTLCSLADYFEVSTDYLLGR